MSLLQTNKKYLRSQPQEQPHYTVKTPTLIETLENEEYDLQYELNQIEEAKSLEHGLRLRLNVVQQSLQAFRSLEAAPEPVQEQLTSAPVVKNVRKATTKVRVTEPKKTATPTQRGIASETTMNDTENIELVHDDFSTFPQ